MSRVFMLLAFFVAANGTHVLPTADPASDAPEYGRDSSVPFRAASSYEHALRVWRTPEDINGWIAANFKYDPVRAIQLSESERTKTERLSIYTPAEFFDTQTGVCVDLARFGVETLRHIDPQSDPKYLMIEFAPTHIAGHTLRLHWLVSFKRDGQTYFFADSKRPGHMAGPYRQTQDFIDEYEHYRGRKIMAFRELTSYQKQQQPRTRRRPAPKEP
jgi:hypothetical protein